MSLRDELEAVRRDHGRLDPPTLVDAARPEEHPLHDRFEWDDSIAGEAWRRDQAHRLIQSVKIVDLRSPDGPRHLRAYVAVPGPTSGQPDYQLLEEVAQDEFAAKLLLAEAEREWRVLKQRYGHLADFIDLIRAELALAS